MNKYVFVVEYDRNGEASVSITAATREEAWKEVTRRAMQLCGLRGITFYREYLTA